MSDIPVIDPTKAHVTAQWKHARQLTSCRFHPGGEFVFAGSEDFSVARFHLATGKETVFRAHQSWVWPLGFIGGGETLLSGGYDGRLVFWPALTEAETPEPTRTIDAHSGWLRAIATSPDGALIATGGNDRMVRLWNAEDGSLRAEFAGHERPVYAALFDPSGQFLLTGDLLGVIKQWEVATGKETRTFDAASLHTFNGGQYVDYGGVRSLAFNKEGTLLAASGLCNASNPLGAVNAPIVEVFDWTTGKKLRSCVTEALQGVLWRAVYHPEGTLIGGSGGSGGGFVLFWKPDQEKAFHKYGLPNTVRDVDLHPNGLDLATAHHDGHVRISRLTA